MRTHPFFLGRAFKAAAVAGWNHPLVLGMEWSKNFHLHEDVRFTTRTIS